MMIIKQTYPSRRTHTPLSRFHRWGVITLTLLILLTLYKTLYAHPSADPQDPIGIHRNTLAEILNWVPGSRQQSFCSGYYLAPNLNPQNQPVLPWNKSEINISSHSARFEIRKRATLTGHVTVNQIGRRLTADRAIVLRHPKTGQITQLQLLGHVRLEEADRLIAGESAVLNFQKGTKKITKTQYRLSLTPNNRSRPQKKMIGHNQVRLGKLQARGTASEIIQNTPGITTFYQATFSTCPPTSNPWQIKTSRLIVNQKLDTVTAYHLRLYIHGIPIFYSPYFTFPLTQKRKSGFLFPQIGAINHSGLDISIPYYWSIASNYDATLTPRLLSRRGILLQGLFRYLTTSSSGVIKAAFLPDDRVFKDFQHSAKTRYSTQFGFDSLEQANSNRSFFSWKNTTHLTSHLTAFIDYSHISDDYYFQDFGSIPELIKTNQLLNQGYLNYWDDFLHISAGIQHYQTLHLVNRQAITNTYSRQPYLHFMLKPPHFKTLHFQLTGEGVYFTRPKGPGENLPPPKRHTP